MAISIGDALLKLKIDKGDFDRDMKGIGASLKKHQKAIGIGMIAVGAAITGIATKSVLDFAKMGDEIAKMAKRTGFSTIALSELRHAAELSGGSLAGLEKASRTLSGTILDAGYGLESYTRAFDKIGVSYKDLAEMKPEQQFLVVMEALAGVENESERAALATDLFGRAGTQLLPMLSDGAEGLKEMRQEAHELGIVFDKEAAVAAEELTDAMTRLKSSIKGAQNSIAEALIPVITPLLDKITDVTKGLGEWIGENETLTKVITGAGGLLMGLGAILLILPKLKAAAIALGHTLKTLLLNPIVALIAALAVLGMVTYNLIQHDIAANKMNRARAKIVEELAKSEGKLTKELLLAHKAYNELALASGLLSAEQEELILKTQETIALWEEGTYVINEATGALELYTEATKESTKETDRAITKQRELFGRLAKAVEAKEPLVAIEMAAARLAGKWGLLRTLEAAAKGVSVEELLTVRPKHLFPQYYPPELQGGGIISKPTLAMLGEKGPEVVMPLDKMSGYRTANLYILLDGRVIGQAVGQPLVDEIRLRTGIKM